MKDIYYKEMADLLKKATGAEHVEMFHHQVLFPKMVFGDSSDNCEERIVYKSDRHHMVRERLNQFITFTFCKKIPQNEINFVSYPNTLLPRAPAKKQGNFKMASELKSKDLPSNAKKNYPCNQCGYSCNVPSK